MSRRLPVLSDRTLAELVAGRLRERGVFSLFVRALGPRQGVFISATGFDQAGAPQRVHGEKASLEAALVALLAELDAPTNVREAAPASPVRAPRPRGRTDTPPRAGASTSEDDGSRRRRVAMEIVSRRGAVTVTSLLQASGIPPADLKSITAHRAFLEQLVADGTLRKSRRFGYVAADAPAELDQLPGERAPRDTAGDHIPTDERELADLEEP